MNESLSNELENLWDRLLSRQDNLVQEAFQELSREEQTAVRAHLERMSEEPGWHPEQQKSAQAALKALSFD